jgi:hypothetical protein
MAKIGIRFAPGEKVKVSKGKEKTGDTSSSVPAKRQLPAGMTPWQPGQSGNPAGRRPMPPEVIEALQAGSEAAAKRLVELCASNDERIALAASEALLSRLYGRPTQQVDAQVTTTNVQQAHLQILLDLQAKREEAMKTIEGEVESEQAPEQKT